MARPSHTNLDTRLIRASLLTPLALDLVGSARATVTDFDLMKAPGTARAILINTKDGLIATVLGMARTGE